MAHHVLRLARLMTRPALFSLCIFISMNAFATITISAVQGASNVRDISGTDTVVFGGMGGATGTDGGGNNGTCSGTLDNVSTCNSCKQGTLQPCNTNRIYPTLQLTFHVKSDKVGGVPTVTRLTTDGGSKIAPVSTPSAVGKNETGTVTVKWSSVCTEMGDGTCVGDGDMTLKLLVGIDGTTPADGKIDDTSKDDSKEITVRVFEGPASTAGDSTHLGCSEGGVGLCQFDVSPGDGKVKVEMLKADDLFPASVKDTTGSIASGIEWENVVFFLEKGTDFSNVDAGSDYFPLKIEKSTDASTSSEFTLESELIEGLENEQDYFFKAAVQDEAMNIAYFTPDAGNENAKDLSCFDSGALTAQPPPCHSARPGAVLGVLSKDVNCFVATAAWGSSFAPAVALLRQFRNTFLLTNKAGKAFVNKYYKYGPYAARYIADKPIMRAAARVVLSPFVAFAWLSLQCGFIFALAMTTTLVTAPIAYRRWRRNSRSRA